MCQIDILKHGSADGGGGKWGLRREDIEILEESAAGIELLDLLTGKKDEKYTGKAVDDRLYKNWQRKSIAKGVDKNELKRAYEQDREGFLKRAKLFVESTRVQDFCDMNCDGKVAMLEASVRRARRTDGGELNTMLYRHVSNEMRVWTSDGADREVGLAASPPCRVSHSTLGTNPIRPRVS